MPAGCRGLVKLALILHRPSRHLAPIPFWWIEAIGIPALLRQLPLGQAVVTASPALSSNSKEAYS
ncbi:hypothetical protein ACFFX0_17795 [Citricoccus parietis]|uniref:Uncharacterized protein n=1 Tax=Citricoccus parietis TaxID=592307 RepID=A0ABV5G1Z9_9MICC